MEEDIQQAIIAEFMRRVRVRLKDENRWCAPREIQYDLYPATRGHGVTGGCYAPEVFEKLTMRKEEKMDRAQQLLMEQRIAEENARIEAEAEVIVAAVNDLNIASVPNGIGVRFTKTYGGDEVYVHLAQRVINDRIGKAWYVTGRQGPLTDIVFESLLAEKGGFSDFIVVYGQLDVKYDDLLRED